MDIKEQINEIKPYTKSILERLYSTGKLQGKEWVMGDVYGGPGESCSVNINTGAWSDFATGEKGGDIVSLYAATKGIGQLEACKELKELVGLKNLIGVHDDRGAEVPVASCFGPPPLPLEIPVSLLEKDGKRFTAAYKYPNKENVQFIILRFGDGKDKSFRPLSWDKKKQKWVAKNWPDKRPLYNPNGYAWTSTLIVEGEKCADFAAKVLPNYNIVTWAGGSNAISKSDWSTLQGTNIYYWHDSDKAGRRTVRELAGFIHIDYILSNPEGDICDLPEGTDYTQYINDNKVSSQTSEGEKELVKDPKLVDSDSPADFETLEELYEHCGLALNSRGKPYENAANAAKILERMPNFKDCVFFEEFEDRFYVRMNKNVFEAIEDKHELYFMEYLQKNLGFNRITRTAASQALELVGNRNRINKMKDYLDSLEWDGKPRVHKFFQEYMGAKDGEYMTNVSKNFWVSMCARIIDPGCKADHMVILEGDQGIGKSTALEIIAGDRYVVMNQEPTNKDFFMIIQGRLIVEIAELAAFLRMDERILKTVLSTPTDSYRPSHARHVKDLKRRCVFVATTNDDEYLKDITGARRYWPVKTEYVKLEELKRDRDQLFAEAYNLYNKSETWWIVPKLEAQIEQEKRRLKDPTENILDEFLQSTDFPPPYSDRYIITEALGKPESMIDDFWTNKRIKTYFKKNGWVRKQGRVAGVRAYRWYPPETQEDLDIN